MLWLLVLAVDLDAPVRTPYSTSAHFLAPLNNAGPDWPGLIAGWPSRLIGFSGEDSAVHVFASNSIRSRVDSMLSAMTLRPAPLSTQTVKRYRFLGTYGGLDGE